MAVNISKLFYHKIVKYALVGGAATLIHIFIASMCLLFDNEAIYLSNVVGFLIAYLFSYFLQSKLVFKHNINVIMAIRYFVVQFSSLIIAIFISEAMSAYNNYLKTVIIALLLPLITFVLHKTWTFK